MMSASTFDSWVTRPKPNPLAHLRLFCFPYAGGGPSIFRTWPDDLPFQIEVCSIRLPGRESRLVESPFTRLSPLVQTLADVLHPYLNMPFAFFGHSMGALISFELARHLRQHGLDVMHLFVSGCRAPHIAQSDPPIHQLPEPEFIEKLRLLNGTPEPVLQNAELMRLLMPVLRADFAICETYTYLAESPLDCPISAFGGLQDSRVTHNGLAAWRDQTCRSFTLRMLPGDHFFLHSARASLLQALARDLKQLLS